MRLSGDQEDEHHFKTPTLRNITLTAPCLHNGRVSSLAEACRLMASTQIDVELTEAEVANLTAFMEALEGESVIHASVKAGPSDQG